MKHYLLYKLLLLAVLTGFLCSSCDIYNETGYQKRYVVESYLVANRTLPPVYLYHTTPVDQESSKSSAKVSGAEIAVSLLNKQGTIQERIPYQEDSAGSYAPTGSLIVQPRHTYQLQVTIPGEDKTIDATTTVPNSYQLKGSVADSVIYQSPNQVELMLLPDQPDTLNRKKEFVFTLHATNYLTATPTPFYADLLEDDENSRLDFRNNSSGLISEGNFDIQSDGSINLKIPWIGFAFYGPNKIVTNSIDQNLYDFMRSQDIQTGGSTLSPGEIPNIIYRIDGGIGIFGSITSDTVSTYLLPPSR